MLELKCNYKGTSNSDACNLCGVELDTTEHLFSCQEITKNIQIIPDAKILQNDEEKSYDELGDFLKKICKIKNRYGKNSTGKFGKYEKKPRHVHN